MANQITTLGNKEEALSEQYDAANVTLGKDRKAVAAAAKAVVTANASTAKAKKVLTSEAVNAYMHNGAAGASAVGDNTLKSANSSLLRAEYVSSLAADESDAQDAYHLASVQAQTAKQNLQTAQTQAQSQVNSLASDRQQVIASQNKLEGVYHQETAQIATLVAQIQAQQEAAAQAAAAAKAKAAQEAAAQQAAEEQQQQAAAAAQQQQQAQAAAEVSPVTTAASPVANASPTETATEDPTTTTTAPAASTEETTPPTTAAPVTAAPTESAPPPSSVGAAAVAAAETQLGVPYVWGGATPGVGFDCSGLVMWAYAQVGISLPHYSGAQFSDGVQIPMSDLEPGDLVFFADPGEHVAMYVGGGDIIEAPETGQSVHIVPMYSEFVQAVRIA